MRISSKGLDLIAEFEGFKDHIYQDIAGHATIGVGHLIQPGESFKIPISKEDAYKLLAKDAKVAEDAVNKNVKVKLGQPQFDSIVSFVYNIGVNAFRQSTFLRILNTSNFDAAADEMLKWANVNGKPSKGLLARRQEEAETLDAHKF